MLLPSIRPGVLEYTRDQPDVIGRVHGEEAGGRAAEIVETQLYT